MTNILFVEDEAMVAKRLQRFISIAFEHQTHKLHWCRCLDDAQEYLDENSIDVLFLDLNLQGKDGFDLLKSKLCESFHTIVISANSDRAIEAFDLGVLDFVAKPFTQERINKAVARLTAPTTGQAKYLSYKSLGNIHLLATSDIAYIKADGHYCHIVSHAGKSVLHEKSLDKVMSLLPNHFIRIHRSYAVSLNQISRIQIEEGSKYSVILKNNQQLPVGRTKLNLLKKRLAD